MDRIKHIISNGGPTKSDYSALKQAIDEIRNLSEEDEQSLMEILKPVLDVNTMQGHAHIKPHGYPGDYEMIDKIYTQWKSNDPNLKLWDDFFHSQEAPIAVRNRKKYFINLVKTITQSSTQPINILNIGSGPARDVKEYYDIDKTSPVRFDCIEMDKKAIHYASSLCHEHIDKINFINKNIFRFKALKKYNLIWSAGLFDYFSDKQFISLLQRLKNNAVKNGCIVIGNFSNNNPSKSYMEKFGSWFLNHRSKDELIELAIKSGIKIDSIRVTHEEKGVNLFLHVKM